MPSPPAFSKKIDKWIDEHIMPVLLAIPIGSILIWGVGIYLCSHALYLLWSWSVRN